MFRQILVHPQDQVYQCILWRKNPSEPVRIYALSTVTYGTSSAPYLTIRTLKQLATDEYVTYPLASEILKNNTFVDDIIGGGISIQSTNDLLNQLVNLLKAGGFELRKWSSNCNSVLETIPTEHRETLSTVDNDTDIMSLLGFLWSPTSDYFLLKFPWKNNHVGKNLTKRVILSTLAQLYDPCGWVTPCIMKAKHYLQKLWLDNVDWDDVLSEKLITGFKHLVNSFTDVPFIKLKRSILSEIDYDAFELHGFADASEIGYCAILYLVTVKGNVRLSNILIAKSRIAPIETVSIPRLELLAAHLLSQLVKHLRPILTRFLSNFKTFLWTDSTVVLSWLSIHPCRLKFFVANRDTQILDIVPPTCWKHVPSAQNPTDLGSRGVEPNTLNRSLLWWNGPEFILKDSSEWPQPISY